MPSGPPSSSAGPSRYTAYVTPNIQESDQTFPLPRDGYIPSASPFLTFHDQAQPLPSLDFPPAHWEAAFRVFLETLGFRETLTGLNMDILTMNPEWERQVLPGAIKEISESLNKVCCSGR